MKKCFNDITVNANPIPVRIKSKRQHINTVTFYLRDNIIPNKKRNKVYR